MMWLLNNISTIIISVILIAVVAAIVAYMVRRRKTSCGCGCQSCAMRGSCHDGE